MGKDRRIVKITSLNSVCIFNDCYHCARYLLPRHNSNNIKINSFPFIVLTFDVHVSVYMRMPVPKYTIHSSFHRTNAPTNIVYKLIVVLMFNIITGGMQMFEFFVCAKTSIHRPSVCFSLSFSRVYLIFSSLFWPLSVLSFSRLSYIYEYMTQVKYESIYFCKRA